MCILLLSTLAIMQIKVKTADASVTCFEQPPFNPSFPPGHGYSVANYCGTTNNEGIQATLSNEALSFTDPANDSNSTYGHISNETWLPVTQDGSQWVETGVGYGYFYNYCISQYVCGTGGCNCDSYDYFWADQGPQYFWIHAVAEWEPDGTQHTYQIINDSLIPNSPYGNNPYYWDIYIDGTIYGVSTQDTSTQGFGQQTGLEVDDGDYPSNLLDCTGSGNEQCYAYGVIDADESTGSFQNYSALLVNDQWVTPSSFSNAVTDFPCGVGTYPSGYCLNGYDYSGNNWWDNKP